MALLYINRLARIVEALPAYLVLYTKVFEVLIRVLPSSWSAVNSDNYSANPRYRHRRFPIPCSSN